MTPAPRMTRLRLVSLFPLVLLAGCGEDMRKSFGLGKNAPDEFQVVRRAPLSLPPDFQLRPPQPGAVRPQEGSATDQAKKAVLDQPNPAPPAASADSGAPSASPRTPVAAATIGGAVPASVRPPQQAAAASPVLPKAASEPAGRSRGEQLLLKQAGADAATPNIRAAVDEDVTKLASADERFIDRLLTWRKNDPTAVVVDANKEAKRLQENAALGKTATDGETPTIKRKNKGIFDGLF